MLASNLPCTTLGRDTCSMDAHESKLFNMGEMIMSAVMSTDGLFLEEQQMAELLECHYSDGLISLTKTEYRQLLSAAKSGGFINAEGYITYRGRIFLAHFKRVHRTRSYRRLH